MRTWTGGEARRVRSWALRVTAVLALIACVGGLAPQVVAAPPRPEPPSEESPYPHSCSTSGKIDPFKLLTPDQWCGNAHAFGPDQDDDPSRTGPPQPGRPLTLTLCRDLQAGDAELSFPQRHEADFAIHSQSGRELWRWSKTRSPGGPGHVREVRAGLCITWKVYWLENDQAGNPVGSGLVTLRATVLAEEINQTWSYELRIW